MNLDELRSVQSKERQTDSLQHLRESFYEDVSAYVSELEDQRDRAAEQAENPFADPEVRQLTDEIETANEVVEAIYDRRLGKLVKRASLAAADMPTEAEGLTAEEQRLFEDLVDRIESNKAHVLDVLEGEADAASAEPASDSVGPASDSAGATADPSGGAPAGNPPSEDPAAADDGRGVPGREDAAGREDVAAREGASVATPEDADSPPDDSATGEGASTGPADDPVTLGGPATGDADAGAPVDEDGAGEPGDDVAADPARSEDPQPDGGATSVDVAGLDDRTTVRVTADVDEFFGVDQREYDLEREDVVTLPAENAEPLLEAGDAERVD
jgi:DNA replication factor GINS